MIYGLFLPLQHAVCKDVYMLMIYGQGTAGAIALLALGLMCPGKDAFGVAIMLVRYFRK